MKLALLSDPHSTVMSPIGRTDDVALAMILKWGFIRDYLLKNQICRLLVAGDLCDVKRSWELLAILSTTFSEWVEKGINVYAVLGQHDSYFHEMSNEATVLGVLMSTGLVTRLSGKPLTVGGGKDGFVNLYGSSYGEPVPKAKKSSLPNILVIHRMIAMNKLWKQQKGMDYAPDFLERNKNYELILCGDAHRQFVYQSVKRTICNTGPMMRLDATEEMMSHKPTMFIYETEHNKLYSVPIPYRTGVLTREHISQVKLEKNTFDEFFDELLEKGKSRYTFKYILRKYLEEMEREKGCVSSSVRKILSEVMSDES